MGYSIDDKVKVLKKSPAACAVITEYSPGFETDPQMKLVGRSDLPQARLVPAGRSDRGAGCRD